MTRSFRPLLAAAGLILVAGATGEPGAPAPAQAPGFAARSVAFLDQLGPWAPAAFIALFVLFCVCCLPGAPLTISAGALFGFGWGTVYVWIAANLGAAAAFLISRRFASHWIRRRLARHPLLAALEDAVTGEGWRIVGLSRLAPGSPFFLLNYLYGVTRIRFRDYLWATAVCIVPSSAPLVYLGSVGEMALRGRIRSPWEWALYGVGLLALFAGVVLVGRRARSALDRALRARSESGPVTAHPPSSETP